MVYVMRRALPLVISESEEEGLRRLMAEGDRGEYRRCLAVLLRVKGTPNQAIAGILGVTGRSVERWIKAYRADGVAGLRRRPHPGGKPRITQDQGRTIAETALRSPRAFGYLRNEWSIRLLARHLTMELGIRISKTHVWEILHELGIVYKRPKAVVRGPDPDYGEKASMVEGYKKAASALLKRGLQ